MPALSRTGALLLTFLMTASSVVAQMPAPVPVETIGSSAEGSQLVTTAPTPQAVSISQVRIVRLSQASGKVLLDRNSGQEFETAFANLPIVKGSRLQTLEGLAEVEFEDNSSLRIAPNSEVDFPELGRTSTGATTNRIMLQKGTLYLSLTKTRGNQFEVAVQGKTIVVPPDSHIRLDVYQDGSELSVLHGKVQVTDTASATSWMVDTRKALKFGGMASPQAALVADKVPGMYDQWDKNLVDYHNTRVASAFTGTSGYRFGGNDLSYYGSFSNLAGCGSVWQPYFTSASWNPYGTGVWAYYQGSGYSWVSPYPWGWAPYHSGEWVSCGGSGWGWRPGQSWSGLQNVSTATQRMIKAPRSVAPPLAPPLRGHPGLLVVGGNEVHFSRATNAQRFEFAKDSAGMGVPRNFPARLQKMSSELSSRGSAVAAVQTAAPATSFLTLGAQAGVVSSQHGNVPARSALASERLTTRPIAPASTAGTMTGGAGRSSAAGFSTASSSHSITSTSAVSAAHSSASSAGLSSGGKSH